MSALLRYPSSMTSMPQQQRGLALIVGLIMLLLFTLMVSSAFMLSNTNLKAVGNMQARDEALAAANFAINQILGSPFTDDPKAEPIDVDINNDAVVDYTVNIAKPTCIRAVVADLAPPSSDDLPAGMASNTYSTVWDIQASVLDPISGASVRVRSGVRVLLSQLQCNAVCPAVVGTPCV